MHLGIIGHGNIARTLIQLLKAEPVERLTVLVREQHLEDAKLALGNAKAASVTAATASIEKLTSANPDVVVECAGQQAVSDVAPKLLAAGIPVIVVSIGALADDGLSEALRSAAREGVAKIILPAGAIGGIDLLAAVAPAGNLKVTYRGSKPPAAWQGTRAEKSVDLGALARATVFFKGSARDAARLYPKNANVAATLALAGAGLDATQVELVADPAASGNRHAYDVVSPVCKYSVEIENAASAANAKTSVATVYSVLREINRMRHSFVV